MMDVLLAQVHSTRAAASTAYDALTAARAAEADHASACEQLRTSLPTLRARLIAERSDTHQSEMSDPSLLVDLQLRIEAAEGRKAEFSGRVASARRAFEQAEAVFKNAVAAYATELECQACARIDEILEDLVAACVEGVAAAEISAKYGKILGFKPENSRHFDVSHGGSGNMLSFLRSLKWPRSPREFKPKTLEMVRPAVNFVPSNCIGVAEQAARIEAAISGEASA